MNGLRLALFLIFGMGALYLLLKRRRFDFFSIGFFAAGIYFLPGFFGFAQYPVWYGQLSQRELTPRTYVVMCAVFAAIALGTLLYDMVPHRVSYAAGLKGTRLAGPIALAVGLAGAAMSVVTTRGALMTADKSEMLLGLNRWIILWEAGASLAAVILFARRRWFLFACAVVLLVADVYIGFRVAAALTMIAIFVAYCEDKGPQRFLVSRKRLVLAGAIGVAFFLVYKFLFVYVKTADWDELARQISSSELYLSSIIYSEPFITQVILDEVLLTEFRVGPGHLKSVGWQFVFFAPSLGATAVSFNDLFQPRLFPHAIGWGMANNIWAEMWSSGGWGLLAAFIVFYVFVIGVASRLLRIDNPELRATAALLFSYWAFYFHRNDVLTQLNLMKRVGVIAAMCLIASLVFADILYRMRRGARGESIAGATSR